MVWMCMGSKVSRREGKRGGPVHYGMVYARRIVQEPAPMAHGGAWDGEWGIGIPDQADMMVV